MGLFTSQSQEAATGVFLVLIIVVPLIVSFVAILLAAAIGWISNLIFNTSSLWSAPDCEKLSAFDCTTEKIWQHAKSGLLSLGVLLAIAAIPFGTWGAYKWYQYSREQAQGGKAAQ